MEGGACSLKGYAAIRGSLSKKGESCTCQLVDML